MSANLARTILRSTVVRGLGRFLFVGLLLGSLSVIAGAYTLVLRDGRRIEVPTNFTLTQRTMTYEAAPGFNVTLLLAVVDVAATERVNNEPAGSFLKHAAQGQTSSAVPEIRRAPVTVTNRELEPARRTRIASEQAYEKRRIELGLPSLEESRKKQALEDAATLELIRARALAQASNESYWRERAGALRDEIVTVDAEIGYLRVRLGEFNQFPLTANSLVTGVSPFFRNTNRTGVFSLTRNSGVFVTPQLRERAVFSAGAVRGEVRINPARRVGRAGFPFSVGNAFSLGTARPFNYVEDSYDLTERLNGLLVTRAGLSAQWRALEGEARDARVPQVWLEP
jgi:hypothetical protein